MNVFEEDYMIRLDQIILSLLLISTLLSVVTSIYLLKRRNTPGALYYGLTGITVTMWCIGYIIEFYTLTLSDKFLGVQIQYLLGIPFTSIFWFAAAINIRSAGERPSYKEFILLSIIPFITMILIWTNETHHLVYKSMSLFKSDSLILIEKEVGIWYYVNVVYSYFFLFSGSILLLGSIPKLKEIYKNQMILFLIAVLLPWISNIIYVIGMNSFMRVDITPVAFTISMFLIGLAVKRYGLFDIVPAAHSLVVKSMHNGLIVTDILGRVVEMNPVMRSILGNNKIIGRDITEVFKEYGLDNESTLKTFGNIEVTLNKEIFDLSVSDITNKNRECVGQIYNFYDITNIKNAENKLLELNSAKDKLFSIIAHDLKNPFFGIIGMSEILEEDFYELDDMEKIKYIKDINEMAKSTYQILENLLEWSRQETGTIEFSPKSFDINSLINESIHSVKQQIELKKLELYTDVSGIYEVFADVNMVKTILRNLISNAIKFSQPGGKIILNVISNDNFAIISVIDSGVGMSENTRMKLFRLEHNMFSVGTMGEKGTGLGLVLCKEFIEKNGGIISVESELEKGSKFEFTLPLAR
jgi:signal transduction histidine kinase